MIKCLSLYTLIIVSLRADSDSVTCEASHGVCQHCLGSHTKDTSRIEMVQRRLGAAHFVLLDTQQVLMT